MATKNETDISQFKINYLTDDLYKQALRNGEINQNELYMTPFTGAENGSVSWNDITNKPTSFHPSSHTHGEYALSGHRHTKQDIGLGNVDNTRDSEKSVRHANTANSVSGTIQITNGGTGATNNVSARANLKATNIVVSSYEPYASEQNDGDIWLFKNY